MKSNHISIAILLMSPFLVSSVWAQTLAPGNQSAAAPAPTAATGDVPRLIKFSGLLLDEQGRPLAGPVGVTFALYVQQAGGAALWLETQNVKPDGNGNYMVLLGANSAKGLPADLFSSTEARWLGIQVGQQPEQDRILLVSVPYALKAGDAETLGGLPASAFVTTGTAGNAANSPGAAATSSPTALALATQSTSTKPASASQPATACTGVTSNGSATTNSIALFTTACNIQSSVITQSATNIGIGTATPAVAVDVLGNNAGMRLTGTGTHQVTVTSTTTGVSGRLGQDANGFFFASDTNGKAVRFLTNNGALNEWMRVTSAGNVGIGTATPLLKLQVSGLDSTSTGIQTRTSNTSTTSNSLAAFSAEANGGTVVTQMAADGLGTGPLGTPGGYYGTFTAHPIGLVTANVERVHVTPAGRVGIGTTAPLDPFEVIGQSTDSGGEAIFGDGGFSTATNGAAQSGIFGRGGNASGSGGSGGLGVSGVGGTASATGGFAGDGCFFGAGTGIGGASAGRAGNFGGDLNVTGAIFAGTKDFKIDHPLDPANKYLLHASVESSEMKNIYDGIATLDSSGAATVVLLSWFEVLNKDFRYQLTAIGVPGPNLHVAQEIQGGRFVIAGGQPGMKVSWQITGVRQDAFAKAHPLQVEEEKSGRERGYYIHPELYGQPEEKQIEWGRHPQMMKQMKEQRQAQRAGMTAAQAQTPQPSHAQSAVQPPAQPEGPAHSEKARLGQTMGAVMPR